MTYIDLKYQGKTSLDYQYIFNFKNWRAGGKKKSSVSRYQWEGVEHKERKNKDVYGVCVLYPYMKTEELNLLKLF
jgi:hypothetical protein